MLERFRGDTQPITWKLSIVRTDGTTEYLEEAAKVEFTYIKKDVEIKLLGVITNASEGLVRFDIEDDTFNVALKADFDVQVTFNNGTRRTFIKDKLSIVKDINRS